MELLILSKLHWDLTAITAYDYVDHLLETLKSRRARVTTRRLAQEDIDDDMAGPSQEGASSYIEPGHLDSLRKYVSKHFILLISLS